MGLGAGPFGVGMDLRGLPRLLEPAVGAEHVQFDGLGGSAAEQPLERPPVHDARVPGGS